MYTLGIYIFILGVRIASLFNKKARLMIAGHKNVWRILDEKLEAGEKYIWFHSASLGEFEQGRLLMERIRKEFPKYKLLLTFFSPSGYEVRKDYKGADIVCYLPFDTPRNARKFVSRVKPCMVFFIKYEFWQNFLIQLKANDVSTYSVASIFRPSQAFFHWYGKSYARMLDYFTHFFVQNEQSRQLLDELGHENVSIVGDTRFDRVLQIREQAKDIPLAAAFAAKPNNDGCLLVAGSTWPPDEDIIIDYFNSHREQRIILAPHVVSDSHLAEIESKLKRPFARFSQAKPEEMQKADCLIIDCYGLLSSIYRYATVAYVGGGFGAGIHNVPEAAVYGVPVIIGPNNKKFMEAQALLQRGAAFQIDSARDYNYLMKQFEVNPSLRIKAGQKAKDHIQKDAGAVDRTFNAIFKQQEQNNATKQ